jgi:hypothetical protein
MRLSTKCPGIISNVREGHALHTADVSKTIISSSRPCMRNPLGEEILNVAAFATMPNQRWVVRQSRHDRVSSPRHAHFKF